MPAEKAEKYAPPAGHTPPRSVRIDGPLWEAGKLAATIRGLTATDIINRALAEYVLSLMNSPDIGDVDRETLEAHIPAAELRRIIRHIKSKPQLAPTAL